MQTKLGIQPVACYDLDMLVLLNHLRASPPQDPSSIHWMPENIDSAAFAA